MSQGTSWLEFWEQPNSIYVGPRHRRVHGHLVARAISTFIPSTDATILDYGCGEASAAEDIATRCGKLILCDAAQTVKVALAQRLSGHPKISVIGVDEVKSITEDSLDLVIVNSVVQYLSPPELHRLLGDLQPKLKDSARLVIGDIIPPEQSCLMDAIALLRLGFDGAFFISAVLGLARLFFSHYRHLRSKLGLTFYREF